MGGLDKSKGKKHNTKKSSLKAHSSPFSYASFYIMQKA